ncbi:MAG: D-alanine--D-alanine ligase [Bacteroidaceae bacterium]|jgi:D-alanine-D-alanine ligase|nr:D-alanine--D-alanine ligase [Bacteroidaceae bacterium]
MQKPIIAIIAGGDSSEHDVSLRSAEGISSWLDRERYIVYTIEVKGFDWFAHLQDGSTAEVNRHDFSFVEQGTKIKPDFAYITIHGTPGENGILQGYFDLLHIPYSTCNLLVAALTFDKFTLNQYLKGFGVKIAESLLLRKGQTISDKDVAEQIGLPCFIKPNGSGSSFGVTRCTKSEDIQKAIEFARKESDDVMIEAELKGTEIANGVYKKQNGEVYVLPITEVVSQNEFFDFDAKYNGQVTEITPARLSDDTTKRVKALTKAIYTILGGSGIMRVDYIITQKEGQDVINLLEINATPGMTQTSFIPQQARADGLEMKDILTEIIEGKLKS